MKKKKKKKEKKKRKKKREKKECKKLSKKDFFKVSNYIFQISNKKNKKIKSQSTYF